MRTAEESPAIAKQVRRQIVPAVRKKPDTGYAPDVYGFDMPCERHAWFVLGVPLIFAGQAGFSAQPVFLNAYFFSTIHKY